MVNKTILEWFLKGDVAIQYQVYRDLLSIERPDLQRRIALEGWGAKFLSKQRLDGHWGQGFYQPKWISSHYTLLDLRNLGLSPDNKPIQESIDMIASTQKGVDGGINPSGTIQNSDVCINGMFLNYACYFQTKAEHLRSIIDFIISQHMPDGGFNCRSNRSGAVHSSLHSTLSVLEGITQYHRNGYTYRLKELRKAAVQCREFILLHRLYLSDRTGEIIHKDFLRLSYPGRWKYNVLRALDCFQYAGELWDQRMQQGIDILVKKRNKNGTWNLQAKHPGQTHFDMEKTGVPSRWNTLRALRVLRHFNVPF